MTTTGAPGCGLETASVVRYRIARAPKVPGIDRIKAPATVLKERDKAYIHTRNATLQPDRTQDWGGPSSASAITYSAMYKLELRRRS